MMRDLLFWKKRVSALAVVILMLVMAACGNNNETDGKTAETLTQPESTEASDPVQTQSESEPLQVVTSFYPLYYLASEIGGEHAEVTNLIAAGIEPHDWTPKSQDLIKASNAELFLYHGAGMEAWIEDFLKGLSSDSVVDVREMSVGIELLSGEGIAHSHGHEEEGHSHDEDGHGHDEEGHEHGEEGHDHDEDGHEHGEEGHDHDEDGHEHGEEGHEHEDDDHSHGHEGHSHSHDIDPHTWVSPKSALKLAENVKNSLVEAAPHYASAFESNYAELRSNLEALDREYTEGLAGVTQKNLVVSHQAFGYLARDYGLNQLAIMGLSPDAEPRAQDLAEIARFVKDNGVKYIFFEELVSDQLAKTLANEAKVDTMVLNPLEGLTKEQEAAGDTYLKLMRANLQNLLQALK